MKKLLSITLFAALLMNTAAYAQFPQQDTLIVVGVPPDTTVTIFYSTALTDSTRIIIANTGAVSLTFCRQVGPVDACGFGTLVNQGQQIDTTLDGLGGVAGGYYINVTNLDVMLSGYAIVVLTHDDDHPPFGDGNCSLQWALSPVSAVDIYNCLDGNVGIGTQWPNEKLEIYKPSQPSIRIGDGRAVENFNAAMTEMGSIKFFHHYNTIMGAKIYTIKDDDVRSWGGTDLRFAVNNLGNSSLADAMTINYLGNVGIGTTTIPSGIKLAVCGTIQSKEVIIEDNNWCDYVFDENYKRMNWQEKLAFINANKHLPAIASGKEIETNGLKTGATMQGMMQNIEENTLDVIDLYQLIKKQNEEIAQLKKEVEQLKEKK